MKIEIIRSSTWINDNYDNICDVLDETIEDCVNKNDKIINIETKTSESGLTRFWIYIEKAV